MEVAMLRIAEYHAEKPWRRVRDWATFGAFTVGLFLTFNPAPAILIAHLLR